MKIPDPQTPNNEELLRNKVTLMESEIAGLQNKGVSPRMNLAP